MTIPVGAVPTLKGLPETAVAIPPEPILKTETVVPRVCIGGIKPQFVI
jgi:hypothetical protein